MSSFLVIGPVISEVESFSMGSVVKCPRLGCRSMINIWLLLVKVHRIPSQKLDLPNVLLANNGGQMIGHVQSRLHLDKSFGVFAKEVLDLLITEICQLLQVHALK